MVLDFNPDLLMEKKCFRTKLEKYFSTLRPEDFILLYMCTHFLVENFI